MSGVYVLAWAFLLFFIAEGWYMLCPSADIQMTSGASNVWSTCAGGTCIYRLWRLRLECCVNTGKNPADPLNLRVKTVLRLPTPQLSACLSFKIWKAINFSVAILPFKESRNFYYCGWFSHSLDFHKCKIKFYSTRIHVHNSCHGRQIFVYIF